MDVLSPRAGLPLLSDYSRFVRRYRLVLGTLVLVGVLAGFAWSQGQAPVYSATASVALAPVPAYVTPASLGLLPPGVSIDTDAQLLHSPQVLGAVADVLGEEVTARDELLSLSASPNSHVLHVTLSAASPQLAADAANAAVDAFIDVRRDTLGALTPDQLRQLRLFVSDQEQQLAQEQSRRLVVPAQDALFRQVLELNDELEELEEARREPAQILRPAAPPQRADRADDEVPIASGAMIGLVCGWLLGTCVDRLPGRRTRRRRDLTSPDGLLTNTHPTRPKGQYHAV